ncbi:winged helix-turn-helix transcriptional regulator [Streptomyces zaomyceticus]|uniref:winged helix-turn-helix transcriptional regulator n=1 Tax=Streptomyces zaomyceticus TaxID=68286 RepID=UPI0034449FB2
MPLPRDYRGQNCALARSVEIVGERWTLLILRDAFHGVRRFGEFAVHPGLPRASSPTGSAPSRRRAFWNAPRRRARAAARCTRSRPRESHGRPAVRSPRGARSSTRRTAARAASSRPPWTRHRSTRTDGVRAAPRPCPSRTSWSSAVRGSPPRPRPTIR